MIKTMMAILMMMAFAASAQAESALLTLPYGIELGKPLTDAQKQCATSKEKEKNGAILYRFKRRFYLYVDELGMVDLVGFNEPYHTPPRAWRNLGLKLCDERTTVGTSYKDAMAIFKREGARIIEDDNSPGLFRTVRFMLGEKFTYEYEFSFLKRKDDEGCGSMGLWSIKVTGDANVYDDY